MSGRSVLDWVGRHGAVLSAAILGAVVVSLAVVLLRRPEPPRIVVQQTAPQPGSSPVPPAVSPQAAAMLVVHVSGEVVKPGVYKLPVGARVEDALKIAGGPTPEADVHRLNLAARVADGQQIAVPRLPSAAQSASPESSPVPSLVNINTASVAELDGLPGVGPVTAQRIVAYRQQHGPFTTVEQLKEAKLVNQATFERIKELVTI